MQKSFFAHGQQWIELRHTKPKMTKSWFYKYRPIHFTSGNASFCNICLSVCHNLTYLSFVYSVLEHYRKFIFYGDLTIVNGKIILRWNGQRSRSLPTKMKKNVFVHISVNNGSIYITRIPKWSSVHSTLMIKYILPAKTLNFWYLTVFGNSFCL